MAQCCSRAEGRDYKPHILYPEKYPSEMKGKSRHSDEGKLREFGIDIPSKNG